MNEDTCKNKTCNKTVISHSLFCGQHTNNRDFNKALKAIKDIELTDIVWDEVDIKKIKFVGKTFLASQMSNLDFNEVAFSKCIFKGSVFEHAVLTECQFIDCVFQQVDFTDVILHETLFKNCNFEDNRFTECSFTDDSSIAYCSFEECNFSGGLFSESGLNIGNKFLNVTFTQVSINQTHFTESQFLEVTFAKTTFYDSIFTNCYFNTVTHDFKLYGMPMLCDFSGSTFTNMSMPKNFRKWNNFNKAPIDFYFSTADWLLEVNHPNYLAELAVVLNHLLKQGFQTTYLFNERIKNIFKRLAADAAHAGDYGTIGNILSDFGRIPIVFRSNASFFLPPPTPEEDGAGHAAKLTITATLDMLALTKVARLVYLLAEMEKQLPVDMPQQIVYIEQGSIVIKILGGLSQLLAGLQTFLNAKKTQLEIEKIPWEIKLNKIDFEIKDQELKHRKKLDSIEIQKAEYDLLEKKLDVLKKLKEQTGFDYEVYRKTAKGKKAVEIGEIIKKEFPLLQLTLEE